VAGVAGGMIYTSTNSGVSWTERLPEIIRCSSVASSSDGTRIVVVGIGNAFGFPVTYPICVSNDSGVNWSGVSGQLANWKAVAASSNGAVMVGVSDLGPSYMMNPAPKYMFRGMAAQHGRFNSKL
jgi:hypothetical protein